MELYVLYFAVAMTLMCIVTVVLSVAKGPILFLTPPSVIGGVVGALLWAKTGTEASLAVPAIIYALYLWKTL